jgi:hypothetical protein
LENDAEPDSPLVPDEIQICGRRLVEDGLVEFQLQTNSGQCVWSKDYHLLNGALRPLVMAYNFDHPYSKSRPLRMFDTSLLFFFKEFFFMITIVYLMRIFFLRISVEPLIF